MSNAANLERIADSLEKILAILEEQHAKAKILH